LQTRIASKPEKQEVNRYLRVLIDFSGAPQVKPLGHIFLPEISFLKAKPITFDNYGFFFAGQAFPHL